MARDLIYKIRIFDGIDVTSDTRIDNPTAWRLLQNLYPEEPGVLVKRPGSKRVYQEITYGSAGEDIVVHPLPIPPNALMYSILPERDLIRIQLNGYEAKPQFNPPDPAFTQTRAPNIAEPINKNLFDTNSRQRTPGDVITDGIFNPPIEINNLAEITLDEYTDAPSTIVGAAWMANDFDIPFYIGRNSQKIVVPTVSVYVPGIDNATGELTTNNPIRTSAAKHADWHFVSVYGKFGDKGDGVEASGSLTFDGNRTFVPGTNISYTQLFEDTLWWKTRNAGTKTASIVAFTFVGIAVNGQDQVIAITRNFVSGDSNAVAFVPMNTYWDRESSAKDFTDTDNFADIYAPRHATIYRGSIVYAGYHQYDHVDDKDIDKSNWISFSEPWEPFSVGLNSQIQIGESPKDPVHAVATTGVDTDSEGIKAQLLVFTASKLTVFDGLPPSALDEGTNFANTVILDVGCISPKSIVNTKWGVVFLGTDSMVYMWNRSFGLVEIGRSIKPIMLRVDFEKMRKVCAIVDDGFYKLSFPDGEKNENTSQLWADLRRFNVGDPRDAGVTWSGIHIGQRISCFVKLLYSAKKASFSIEANPVLQSNLYGGSAVDSSIYNLHHTEYTDSRTIRDDPVLNPPDMPIQTAAVSPQMDLGDAHEDKELVAVNIGAGTNILTEMEVDLAVDSEDFCNVATVQNWTRTISPCGWVLGNAPPKSSAPNIILNRARLSTSRNYELFDLWPSERQVGRAFNVSILEDPTVITSTTQAKIIVSDFSVIFRRIARRG